MKLALFFTRGISLEQWVSQGLFDREKLIYEEHIYQNNFEKIYWFTYGSEDKKISQRLKKEDKLHKDIEVISMPRFFNIPKLGTFLYSLLIPFFYFNILKKIEVLKSNQMDGSWSALITKKIYDKKLVLRTGYTWSKLKEVTEPNSILKIRFIKFIEKMMYKNCDIAIVSSYNNKQYLNQKYGCKNINVLYNYVDLNRFYDFKNERYEDSIVFIGRLSEEKNIFSLIEASHKCNLNLKIYGNGPLREKLKQYINENRFNSTLMGSVSNSEIPKILNENKYYALVSYQEGMPKSLMEAMACGCVCIGTDTDGINELIEDEVNGFLAKGFNIGAIEVAINTAINFNQKEILKQATTFSKKYFDIKNIVTQEYGILKGFISEN